MNSTRDHDPFVEQIGAYVTGGLNAKQREELEAHTHDCTTCTTELESFRALDREMAEHLLPLVATNDLEDRIADRLRSTIQPKRRFSPIVRRAAIAAAAAIVVGGFGVMGRGYLEDGRLPIFAVNTPPMPDSAESKFNEVFSAGLSSRNENKGAYPRDRSTAKAADGVKAGEKQVTHGDGHVEFQTSPFAGVRRDMILAGRASSTGFAGNTNKVFLGPSDGNDAVLLPVDNVPPQNAPQSAAIAHKLEDDKNELKDQIAAAQTPALPGIERPAIEQTATTQPAAGPRIIREGTMEFEVDSFDSSFLTIEKVVGEEGGFVAAVDSDKLTNGKVRGTITLRVPPDHLDVLVMKLRSLGELKTQRLGSSDISKAYTDLEGRLRAAKAMESRLLDLIKTAQGKVKDLLEAENELGTWRTKIETIQGELNYYDNRVSLATLTLVANERDVNTPASVTRHEQITAGLEIADVVHGRVEILKSIDAAKGRVLESSLQQLEAGQQAAKVVAEMPAESAGPILDRLHQLGNVTRLDAQRSEDAGNGETPPRPAAKVEQQPTRLTISLYNVANIAPRVTTSLTLTSDDVEKTYRAALKNIAQAGGRLIDSKLNRDGTSSIGELRFEINKDQAESMLKDLRSAGQATQLNSSENPDTANVTTAKQGFVVQLTAADQLPPRQTRSVSVQAQDIVGTQQKLIKATEAAGGKVISSTLNSADTANANASLAVGVPLGKSDALLQSAGASAVTTNLSDDPNVDAGPLSQARITFSIHGESPLLADQNSVWNSLRNGLATSARGLLWSLEVLTIGVCLVAPWALVIAGGWWIWKRRAIRH